MTPAGAKPFDMALHHHVGGQIVQGATDVITAHLPHTPEQVARIIEHDPWLASLLDQLGQQICQTPIARRKGLCVVVVTLVRVLSHVLQMGDQLTINACRHRRLVHMQSAGETRAQLIEIQIAAAGVDRLLMAGDGVNLSFPSADRRAQAVQRPSANPTSVTQIEVMSCSH